MSKPVKAGPKNEKAKKTSGKGLLGRLSVKAKMKASATLTTPDEYENSAEVNDFEYKRLGSEVGLEFDDSLKDYANFSDVFPARPKKGPGKEEEKKEPEVGKLVDISYGEYYTQENADYDEYYTKP